MNGTQGGSIEDMRWRYLAKVLLLSMVSSHAANWEMALWLTCSHVRFSLRIGGVFNPEVIAIIVERLLRARQR